MRLPNADRYTAAFSFRPPEVSTRPLVNSSARADCLALFMKMARPIATNSE